MKPRIRIVYTGGTIGMEPSVDGYRPGRAFSDLLRTALPIAPVAADTMPDWDVIELPQPIDSANLQPQVWSQIGALLQADWARYDGFVILHGTDTLAWTASALSFMLQGVDKPVILTGAQIPLTQPRSDGPANLQAALALAAMPAVREVAVYFGRHLYRGNRCVKVSSAAFDGFDSPNYPALARSAITLQIRQDLLLPASAAQFVVPQFQNAAVAVAHIYPGMGASVIHALTQAPETRALILRSYGAGNVPDADAGFMAALEQVVARGITVVNTSQCLAGGVSQGAYQTSAALTRIGVISAADMTLEAAFAKLHFLLATETGPDRVRSLFRMPLAGECSLQP